MPDEYIHIIPANVPEKIGYDAVRKAVGSYLFTTAGKQLLQLLKPSASVETVDKLNTQTGEMLALLRDGESVPFTRIGDIEEWLDIAKTDGAVLNLEAFVSIREHARLARVINTFFVRLRDEKPELRDITKDLQIAETMEKEINRAVTDQGSLKDDASRELKNIRNRLNSKRQTLRNEIQKIFRKAQKDGMASDEGPTLRGGRMVIPIQVEFKRKIDGFVHDLSASGQTVYLEPVEALQINNDIRELETEERREIERILRTLTNLVRKNRELLIRNETILSKLDLIHAKTRAGLSWEGVIPNRSDSQHWLIIRGKNPSLILKNRGVSKKEKEEIVPLDFEIKSPEKGIIISGPNAGGKSVALKTIGILSYMYQSGIPLPVQPDSEIPVISGLYLDMGDDQSIENDLSTFSSRLKWMRDTLDRLDEKGLVLIDEAGTGTDPEEGGALFQAFIEKVLDTGGTVIATTHHGALKVFAHDHPKLSNGAMEFNQETLAPTYRFRKGIPGSSYAFEIAGRMKLPDELLDRSRALLGEQRDRMANLLLSLEQRLQQAEEAQNKYEKLRHEAENKEQEYREKSEEIDRRRDEKLRGAYLEADRIMQDANRRIEQAVEKIVLEGKENRDDIRKIRRELSGHKKKIRDKIEQTEEPETEPVKKDPPVIGDKVSISGSETVGELIEKEGTQAVVLAGGLKVKTRFDNLVKSTDKTGKENKVDRWKAASYTRSITGETVKPSLNLRGMRGDEAVKELMLYIDKAVAGGLQEVDIIHGKGEGILKKLVHEYLDKRKEVKHFELAPWERGGPGCTVVVLE